MGCFSGRLMSSASDQKLFCKLSSPFWCSFDEFVEEKVISPSYSSAILTPPPPLFCLFLMDYFYKLNLKIIITAVFSFVRWVSIKWKYFWEFVSFLIHQGHPKIKVVHLYFNLGESYKWIKEWVKWLSILFRAGLHSWTSWLLIQILNVLKACAKILSS